MPEVEDFKLESFQESVIKEIKTLQLLVEIKARHRESVDKLASVETKDVRGFLASLPDRFNEWISVRSISDLKKLKKIDERSAQARAFLQQTETQRRLCPALRQVENNLSALASRIVERDAQEIAATVTPILAPLARDKSISLELDPTVFALCAWMIARTGVRVYCSGTQTETNPNTE